MSTGLHPDIVEMDTPYYRAPKPRHGTADFRNVCMGILFLILAGNVMAADLYLIWVAMQIK